MISDIRMEEGNSCTWARRGAFAGNDVPIGDVTNVYSPAQPVEPNHEDATATASFHREASMSTKGERANEAKVSIHVEPKY